MYGVLSAAGCGVMVMTVGGDSGVITLGGATSLEFNLGVILGDGTWMGLIRCEHREKATENLRGYVLVVVELESDW
jgi:hypothetical protein